MGKKKVLIIFFEEWAIILVVNVYFIVLSVPHLTPDDLTPLEYTST